MEHYFQTDYFYYNIITRLTPLDLLNLKRTNKLFSSIVTFSIMKKLILYYINKRLLLIFGENTNKIKEILNNTKTVISGSFLIQCILNEYWNDSDIDIYSPVVSNKKCFIDHDNPFTDIEKFLHEKYRFTNTSDAHRYGDALSNNRTDIKWVRTYQNSINKIQIIQVEVENNFSKLKEFIHNTFDFNICKNIYYIDNNKENISIFNLLNVLNKTEKFKTKYNLKSSMTRCLKYRNRGFDIHNNRTYECLANLSYNGYGHKTHEIYTVKKNNTLLQVISGDINVLKQYINPLISSGKCFIRHLPTHCNYLYTNTDCLLKFCESNVKHSHIIAYGPHNTDLIFIYK